MRPSELQIKYQRNMLFGLGISVMFSLVLGVWVRSLDGPTSEPAASADTSHLVILDREQVEDTEKAARTTLGGLNPYAKAHEGFLGFVNLRPQEHGPERVVEPPSVFVPDLTPLKADETPSFSAVEGEQEGLFVPQAYGVEMEPMPSRLVSPPVTREVQVVHKVDPEYPFVARDAGKEGRITVLVYVDSSGELTTFPPWIVGEGIQTLEYTVGGVSRTIDYAVKEDPPGWFFAQNFVNVLPKWVFSPRIENGKPICSLLRIKYNFCLGSSCLRYELERVGS